LESQEFSTINKIEHLLHTSCSVVMASTFDEQGEPLCEQAHLLIKASEADDLLKSQSGPFMERWLQISDLRRKNLRLDSKKYA